MIGFCPLASGSKGNCTYLGTPHTKILIDAGLPPKQIAARLAQIQVDLKEIDAILVTHEHTDHIKGIEGIASRYQMPVFANCETARAIHEMSLSSPRFKIFSTGERFEFGDLDIHPFSVQHDTLDPVAFTIQTQGMKLGFCTDLGFVTTLVSHSLRDCDYLVLEANHQPSLVHASARPMIYKQRVLGRQGHLSNEECGELLAEVFHPHLKHVHLAHLSSECNVPELALKVVSERLGQRGASVDLSIAYQDRISKPIFFR